MLIFLCLRVEQRPKCTMCDLLSLTGELEPFLQGNKVTLGVVIALGVSLKGVRLFHWWRPRKF